MTHEYHTPILVDETLKFLITNPDGTYVDGTLGGGGHAEQILTKLSPNGKLIGFDVDNDAIQYASGRLKRFNNTIFLQNNFSNIKHKLASLGVNHISGLLLDLGVSSHQLDSKNRGFSYRTDERLDLRMNQEQQSDGWGIVNTYEQKELADVLWKYGEERNSRRIAKKIIFAREKQPINTTQDLARVVESAVGGRWLTKSLARVFQAIRIEVNNELENLQRTLNDVIEIIELGGRVVVISYHSLEDRIVKHTFRSDSQRLSVLTSKPIQASQTEIIANSRARSAKLRAAERI